MCAGSNRIRQAVTSIYSISISKFSNVSTTSYLNRLLESLYKEYILHTDVSKVDKTMFELINLTSNKKAFQ